MANGASYALDTIARLEAKCEKQSLELRNLRATVRSDNESLEHLRGENAKFRDDLIAANDRIAELLTSHVPFLAKA